MFRFRCLKKVFWFFCSNFALNIALFIVLVFLNLSKMFLHLCYLNFLSVYILVWSLSCIFGLKWLLSICWTLLSTLLLLKKSLFIRSSAPSMWLVLSEIFWMWPDFMNVYFPHGNWFSHRTRMFHLCLVSFYSNSSR